MKGVSTVVINYNGKEYLDKCLGELVRQGELSEIIVVDDASTDGSVELVRNKYKNCELIVNTANSGPVYSRQKGFERSKGEYVVFIDCDILIKKDTILNLYDYLEKNNDVWLAGSKLYEANGNDVPWNYGHFPNVFKNFFLTFKKDKYFGVKTKKVDWVSEACFMVKGAVFDKIGGFDTNLFMYHEAPDISIRARKIGFFTAIVFEAKATHLNQKSKLLNKDRFYVFNEASNYFYKKHYSKIAFFGIYLLIYFYYLLRKIGIKFHTHYE